MTEEKKNELYQRFLNTFEEVLKSSLPTEEKLQNVEALYLAYCGAVDKKPNYELLNHL